MPTHRPDRTSTTLQSLVLLMVLGVVQGATLRAQAQADGKLPVDRRTGAASVTESDCKEWLYTLASPEFEGRGTGQPGFQKAADFVAAHWKALGLEARGDNGTYFQQVPWSRSKVQVDKSFIAFRKDGTEVLRIPASRLTGTATSTLSAKGDVVLLTIDADQARASRPAIPGLDQVDVSGKIVVVYIRTADGQPAASPAARYAAQQSLQGKQAAAILFAQPAAVKGSLVGRAGASRRSNPAAAGARRSPLDATFGGTDVEALLAAMGKDTKGLATEGPIVTVPPMQAELEIGVADEQAPAMNVWAVLPGTDPKLKDEYVVIGSHLDHLGKRGDSYSPGADDDGSGTTGVMAAAAMFVNNPVKPKRSILFVCFCGEENGLVGSRFFASNCPVPLSSITGQLQMDMIGRDEEENAEGDKGEKAEDNRNSLHLVGTQKLAPALHTICLQKNEAAGFDLEYDQEGMFGRSDHANFARMGVPIAFFFTGLHRDYHQTTDTPDKINYEKLLRIARYVYDIGFELASSPTRPEVDPELWATYRGKGAELPAAPMSAPKGKAKGKEKAKD